MSTSIEKLPPIILASGSPRRKELLASLGLTFQVLPADIDESAIDAQNLPPAQTVCELARQKAQAKAKQHPEALVIGGDTIVVLNQAVFGKPADKADAHRMLSALQGTTHQVYSGLSVIYQSRIETGFLATDVTFKPMSAELISRYIETGEPMDKAGAYAIQGYGSLNIERINGCYFNVVGMSLYLLNELFQRHGLPLLQHSPNVTRKQPV